MSSRSKYQPSLQQLSQQLEQLRRRRGLVAACEELGLPLQMVDRLPPVAASSPPLPGDTPKIG